MPGDDTQEELAFALEGLLEEGEDIEDYDFVMGLLWQHHPVCQLLLNALINKANSH